MFAMLLAAIAVWAIDRAGKMIVWHEGGEGASRRLGRAERSR